MGSRFYNPKTGTFLTQDTYSGNPYEPWTAHLYSYCSGNSTSMVDPTGHVQLMIGDNGEAVCKGSPTASKSVKKTSNPVKKSMNSLKQLACDTVKASEGRDKDAFNSTSDFVNWLTLGESGASEERASNAFDSTYDFFNWLSLGTVDMVKGTFAPKDPLSEEHWANSIGLATLTCATLKIGLSGTVDISAETTGEAVKTDFYVTPKGDAIPASEEGFYNNLSTFEEKSGKFVSNNGSNGPIRIRIEDAHPENSGFLGDNPYHEVPHIHIEYRKNGLTGPWGEPSILNKFTLPQDWLK